MRVRALIVDDSPLIRGILRTVLSKQLEVVGEAADGMSARELVRTLRPDVVTMDVVMPMMGGLDAIGHIMAETPTPIVVVADDHGEGPQVAMDALARGAVEVFGKPQGGFDDAAAAELIDTVLRAARTPVVRQRPARGGVAVPREMPRPPPAALGIVGSTGAPQLLRKLLGALSPRCYTPIVIVQHTSRGFTGALATWLGEASKLTVALACDGDRMEAGRVLLAPDDQQLEVTRGGVLRVRGGDLVDGHRPSGTVLLRSLAAVYGSRCAGMVLTGMGRDGAEGLAAIEAAGGVTIVEDPASAVIAGMPTAALARAGKAWVEATDALPAILRRLLGDE